MGCRRPWGEGLVPLGGERPEAQNIPLTHYAPVCATFLPPSDLPLFPALTP